MIYLLTIILVLSLSFVYDGRKNTSTKRNLWYKILLIWFIIVSALSFNVGSDIANYVSEFDDYKFSSIKSLPDLFAQQRRQPGWVLLLFICHKITGNFILVKSFISVVLNLAVFKFIKENTRYIFLGVFLYGISLYLNMNFNILRQSLACAMFLFGFSYFEKKQWGRYLVFAFISFMFHSSGIICFLFPLTAIFKLRKEVLIGFFILLIACGIYAIKSDNLVFYLSQFLASDVSNEEINALGERFLNSATGPSLNFNGLIMIVLHFSIVVMVLWFNITKTQGWTYSRTVFVMLYLLFYLLNCVVPVIFFRFLFYTQFIYLLALANFLYEMPRHCFRGARIRYAVMLTLVAISCLGPMRQLFAINEESGIELAKQFIPYHSVLNPIVDPVRAEYFGFYE